MPSPYVSRIAHRGNSFGFRENTLAAFASAIEVGCDWLEVDVRTTRDGHSIVLHDETLLRLWGLPAAVADCDLSEVRELGFGAERVPVLREVLDLARGSATGVLIDSTTVRDTLAAYNVATGLSGVVTSYCGATEAMLALRDSDHGARLQYGHPGGSLDLDLVHRLRPEVVTSEWVLINDAHIEQVHAAGCQAWAWTVNDAATMRWLMQRGIDGITSDRVRMLAEVVGAGPLSAGPTASQQPVDLEACLTLATDIARWTIPYTRDAPLGRVSTKAHAADFLTEVDTAVERHVREVIGAAMPGHLVVGEEEGGSAQPGVPTWYLDPVDGTTNLANNIPWTSMSLALAVDRQPQVAVVCNPWTEDVLAAAAGRGATRNGMPLRLDGDASLRVILTELRAHKPWSGQVVMLIRAAERHVTTRVMGSGTLTLAGIAAGWGQAAVIDAFSAVDHLAALLLVREAGGVVRDAGGRDVVFPDPGTPILAAHPAVADEAYAIWRGRD